MKLIIKGIAEKSLQAAYIRQRQRQIQQDDDIPEARKQAIIGQPITT